MRGVNVTDQLTLFEAMPVADAAPVWSALTPEERAAVLSLLARLMARAVADLRDERAKALENGHE